MVSTIALEFLLVSNHYPTLTAVADGLRQIGASLDFAPTSEAARDYVERRKVDGVIVDLDVPGAHDFIRSIRQGIANRGATVFACMPSDNKSPVALVAGASFLLQRPLTPESVASQVAAAQKVMSQERRRFFRVAVSLPVFLTANGIEQRAMLTTVGEGGMAAFVVQPVEPSRMIDFVFDLSPGGTIAGKGSVAWANNEGMIGIKFQFLRGDGEEILKSWLRDRQPARS